jgi:hypothetical protein
MRFSTPAAFSTEPALDAAIAQGFVAWLRAANERGPIAVTQWLERRAIGSDFPFHAVFARIEAVLPLDPDRDIHVVAELCHDLTDRVGPFDAEMAELFCQPVLRSGVRENELNTVAEAAAVITGLARDFGEPQTIARLWLGLLNWTRVRSGETPVEFLETGFDQLSEAAAMDHQPGIAARLEYRLAELHQSLDDDAESVTGDWTRGSGLPEAWFADSGYWPTDP